MAQNSGRNDRQDAKQRQAAAGQPTPKRGWLRRAVTPDFGSGPAQVRETHGMFLTILASLFGGVGVLPANHPYLQPGTQFSLGQLFAATLARIDWNNKQTLPQTVFFCAVWGILASSVLYLVTAVLLFVATPSHAYAADTSSVSTTDSGGMFDVDSSDLGQQFIHYLVENQNTNAASTTDPLQVLHNTGPLQGAFRDMLKYYSSVILIIASFMLLYHIIMLIVNSAWSGKPLEGANQIWGPLRLAIAIGLLVPLSNGLNTGQVAVLKIAETGSAAGTKIWNIFTHSLAERSSQITVQPDNAVRDEFMKMILVYACYYDINMNAHGDANKMVYRFPASNLAQQDGHTLPVRLGSKLGYKYCGEISFPDKRILTTDTTDGNATVKLQDATAMQQLSSNIISKTSDAAITLNNRANDIAHRMVEYFANYNTNETIDSGDNAADSESKTALQNDIRWALNDYYQTVNQQVAALLKGKDNWKFLDGSSWVLAGAYYMEISAYQNTIFSAIKTPPHVELGPVFGREMGQDNSSGWSTVTNFFSSIFTKGGAKFASAEERHFVQYVKGAESGDDYNSYLKEAIYQNKKDSAGFDKDVSQTQQNNNEVYFLSDAVGALSKTFTMDKGHFIDIFKDNTADPFAAFVNAGHYVLDAGLVAFAGGIVVLVEAEGQGSLPFVGGGATATVTFASWIMTLAVYLISIGALLCFVLPLVPVIKFLGGVVTWMLAIMEAIVGMPLFALAHLTPGGNGLLDPARQGYLMLFHIAIRPMLMVFGMIVAIIIITPAVYLLNAMFLPAMNMAWQPNDGGLILASILFGLWGFFAYGILKKVFGFQDYLSHSSMRWLGGGGYQFERYQGEGNALAAYGAFQQVTGMANQVIGERKGKAIESVKDVGETNRLRRAGNYQGLKDKNASTRAGRRALNDARATPEYKQWEDQEKIKEEQGKQKESDRYADSNLNKFKPYLGGSLNKNNTSGSSGGPGGGGSGGGSAITALGPNGKPKPGPGGTGGAGAGWNPNAQSGSLGAGASPYGKLNYTYKANDMGGPAGGQPRDAESEADVKSHFQTLGLGESAGLQDVAGNYQTLAREQAETINTLPPGSAARTAAENKLARLDQANDSLITRMGGGRASGLLAGAQRGNISAGGLTLPPAATKLAGAAMAGAAAAMVPASAVGGMAQMERGLTQDRGKPVDIPLPAGVDGKKWESRQFADSSIGLVPKGQGQARAEAAGANGLVQSRSGNMPDTSSYRSADGGASLTAGGQAGGFGQSGSSGEQAIATGGFQPVADATGGAALQNLSAVDNASQFSDSLHEQPLATAGFGDSYAAPTLGSFQSQPDATGPTSVDSAPASATTLNVQSLSTDSTRGYNASPDSGVTFVPTAVQAAVPSVTVQPAASSVPPAQAGMISPQTGSAFTLSAPPAQGSPSQPSAAPAGNPAQISGTATTQANAPLGENFGAGVQRATPIRISPASLASLLPKKPDSDKQS